MMMFGFREFRFSDRLNFILKETKSRAGSAERFGPSQLHSHSDVAYWFFTSSESQITDAGHVLLRESRDAAGNQQLCLSPETIRRCVQEPHQHIKPQVRSLIV